jgi:glycosyltransferase involved in cell wall biosynthesis
MDPTPSGILNRERGTWLFVVPWELDDRRGVDQVIISLSSILRRRGFTPSYLVDHWTYEKITAVPESSFREAFYRLRAPVYGNQPLRSFARFMWELPSMLSRLAGFLRANRVTVVNAHYPRTGNLLFCLVRTLRLARFRFVVSVHGSDLRSAKNSSWIEKMQFRLLLSCADAVVACSQALATEVTQVCPGAKPHVFAVHNGINIPSFLMGRDTTFRLPQDFRDTPYLLTVAAYEWKKGLDVLIEAAARVLPRYRDLQIVLVGGDSPDRERIEALVKARGLTNRVHMFVDIPHSRILTFMERARLFVLPSRIEPFGLVLLEAAACARPVIATNVGGIPEIIQDKVSGRLVPPEDPAELASAICDLMDNPEKAQRFGFDLQQRVAEEFSWDRALGDYLRIVGHGKPIDTL